jgi:hypothetical protein
LRTRRRPRPRFLDQKDEAMSSATKTDTTRGVTTGGGGETGPSPELRRRVVSGDRNTGEPGNKQKRHKGEQPRDKPVEEEADKDIKNGG